MYLFLLYFNQVFNALEFGVWYLTLNQKLLLAAFGLVGCFKGYYVKGTAECSVAANSAVVSPILFYYRFYSCFVTNIFMIYLKLWPNIQEKKYYRNQTWKKAMEYSNGFKWLCMKGENWLLWEKSGSGNL
jgi:hypothetical protein